jgi:hypothetical protein
LTNWLARNTLARYVLGRMATFLKVFWGVALGFVKVLCWSTLMTASLADGLPWLALAWLLLYVMIAYSSTAWSHTQTYAG